MKIYHNSTFIAVLKRFIPRKGGDWMSRLIGINLQEDHAGNISVFPVYRSIQFRRIVGGIYIEIPVADKQLILYLGKEGIQFDVIEESQLHLFSPASVTKTDDPEKKNQTIRQ